MYQLFFYREGRRKSPEMNTVAKDMSDAELTALADYVAGLPPPPPAPDGAVDEARYRRGSELAAKRICGTCHNLQKVVSSRKSDKEWERSVYDMVSRGAQIFPEEADQIVKYLAKSFPPKSG